MLSHIITSIREKNIRDEWYWRGGSLNVKNNATLQGKESLLKDGTEIPIILNGQ